MAFVRSQTKFIAFVNFTVIVTIIFLCTKYFSVVVDGQVALLPGESVVDPFKDNPKWLRFKEESHERLEQLKVLVDNVWNLLDDISNPTPAFNFKNTFTKLQFQAFVDFFAETEFKLHTQSVYSTLSTAIGIQNSTSLYEANSNSKDPLNALRLKWVEIHGMAQTIHEIFNQTTFKMFTVEPSTENTEQIFEATIESHPLWFADESNGNGSIKMKTLKELATDLDSGIIGSEKHLLRGLVVLLQNMDQKHIDVSNKLNYFCYGNNRFGILPDLVDIVSNTALYLATADMKKLVLDVYTLTYSVFYGKDNKTPKDEMTRQRIEIWNELVQRVDHKVNFTYLDGEGWKYPDGSIIFKCDEAPKSGHELAGQWGRNVTTGVHPNASHVLESDPQAGPYKLDGTIGYYDDRSQEMNYVAFEKTFQGYIESEMLLNPKGNCVGTCEDYNSLIQLCHSDHCQLLKNYHCSREEPNCLGTASCNLAKSCVRASSAVRMCLSNDSGKRYDWINFNDKIITRQNATHKENCDGGNSSTAVERWDIENGIIMMAPVYCELCLCTCMSPKNEDDQDYFDLQPAVAEDGYIVSGLKFVKEGHVIRLVIEQGKPLINGNIDVTTLKWVEPLPADTKNQTNTIPLGFKGFLKFNFNLLVGEAGTVLTGIRFMVDEAKALNLEVQVTPITWTDDLNSGPATLVPAETKWITTPNSTTPRQPLEFLPPLNNPITQQGPSMPDTVLNSFVEFKTTSYDTDLAQSIVPFFDAQSVYHEHEGRSWLKGAGIMHKGKPESTGFITLIIVAAKPNSVIKYLAKPKP